MSRDTLILAVGLLLGWILGRLSKVGTLRLLFRRNSMQTLDLDCTVPVTITATAADTEGNPKEGAVEDLKLEVVDPVGEFGTLEQNPDTEEWTFNPGTAGATGRIKGEALVDGVDCEADAQVTLKVGAETVLGLVFTPKPAE